MATPDYNLRHGHREKAQYYKAEFIKMMAGVTAAVAEDNDSIQRSVFDYLSEQHNIIGLGYGSKITEGNIVTDEEAVRVYVREKLPRSSLSQNDSIPAWVNGLTTDVIPTGDIAAAARPTSCGVSIGHHAITSGTLGCLVKKNGDEDSYYILSNNHVLADCDRGAPGDLILEPGPDDGGSLDDPIAELADFEPIMGGNPVTIDAAIARLLVSDSVTKDISGIGYVQAPPMQAALNQLVLKSGRTTNLTRGLIVGIDEDVRVRYGTQRVSFEGQLAITGSNGLFAGLGDSGSLLVDAQTKCPVGLFFAVDLGSSGTAFANPIDAVLARFSVEIL